jgi:hypothetical protein
MFRQLTKLVQPTRVPPLNEATPGETAGVLGHEAIQTKPDATGSEPHRVPQIDLSLSLNLLHQAIKRFADLKPNAGLTLVDPRLIDELRKRILAYESERMRLRSDLEYAQHCAHSYWERCKSVEAELERLRGGFLSNPVSEAGSKRGVL